MTTESAQMIGIVYMDVIRSAPIEDGRLYFLQTRPGKRTPWAALRIAIDMTMAGIIDRGTALERLAAYDLDDIQRTREDKPARAVKLE